MATTERLQERLNRAGWAVCDSTQRPRAPDELLISEDWQLESRLPPVGRRVLVELRVTEPRHRWAHAGMYWLDDSQVLSVRIHLPHLTGDAPSPEAVFAGDEVGQNDFRQVVRALEWFRDPVYGSFWHEVPQPNDWTPPPAWEGEQWSIYRGLDHRWPTCRDPQEMLRLLPGRPDERRLQLFACACCRRLAGFEDDERNIAAVLAAERYAEGLTPRRTMKRVCRPSALAWLAKYDGPELAHWAVRRVCGEQPTHGPTLVADLLRDVFGNPFRPVPLQRGWLRQAGGAAQHLADAIAAEQRFDEMPILADALEDAGCAEAAVLAHCRGGSPHVRGCWVLDLLLGKG